jgi:hypothetical protein
MARRKTYSTIGGLIGKAPERVLDQEDVKSFVVLMEMLERGRIRVVSLQFCEDAVQRCKNATCDCYCLPC